MAPAKGRVLRQDPAFAAIVGAGESGKVWHQVSARYGIGCGGGRGENGVGAETKGVWALGGGRSPPRPQAGEAGFKHHLTIWQAGGLGARRPGGRIGSPRCPGAVVMRCDSTEIGLTLVRGCGRRGFAARALRTWRKDVRRPRRVWMGRG